MTNKSVSLIKMLGLMFLLFAVSMHSLAFSNTKDGSSFEEKYRKLQLEYLRVNKLYLEERLKNQEMEKKKLERNEKFVEVESDLQYCERSTEDYDSELDVTFSKMEQLENEIIKLKSENEKLKRACQSLK